MEKLLKNSDEYYELSQAILDHEFSKAEEMLKGFGDEQLSLDVALYKAIVEYRENQTKAKFEEIEQLLDKGASPNREFLMPRTSYSCYFEAIALLTCSPKTLDVMLEMMRRKYSLYIDSFNYKGVMDCFMRQYEDNPSYGLGVNSHPIEEDYGICTPEYLRIGYLATCYNFIREFKENKSLSNLEHRELQFISGYDSSSDERIDYVFERNGWDIKKDGRTELVRKHEKICMEELKKIKREIKLNPKSYYIDYGVEGRRYIAKELIDTIDKVIEKILAPESKVKSKGFSSIFKRKHSGDDARSHHKDFPQEERVR